MNLEQNVPKRQHIKSRRPGITQKKSYNIQNTTKVWNKKKIVVLLVTWLTLWASDSASPPCKTHSPIYRVSQEECARLQESVPYVKVYLYNPKHLYPKLKGYGDNGQRKVRSSCGSTYCTCSADPLRVHQNAQSAKLNQYFNTAGYSCAM